MTSEKRIQKSGTHQWFVILAFLVFFLSLLIFILQFPGHYQSIQNEWRVRNAWPAVQNMITLGQFGRIFIVLRYFALILLMIASSLLLVFARLERVALVASIFLSTSGQIFGIAGEQEIATLAPPFTQIFEGLIVFQFVVLIFSIFHLAQLFPDGKYISARAARIAPWAGGLLIMFSIGIFSGVLDIFGDAAWISFMLIFAFSIFSSVIFMLLRLRTVCAPGLRRVLFALLAIYLYFIVNILLSDFLDDSSYFSLIAVLFDLILPVGLAGSFIIAIWKGHFLLESNKRVGKRIGIISAAFLIVFISGGWLYTNRLARANTAIAAEVGDMISQHVGKVIIDTDMGNDDILALLFLMEHPGVEVQAVTVVGTGLVHCDPGIRNVLGLLELSESPETPVSCGSEEPFGAEYAFPTAWRSGADRLWGLYLSKGERLPDSRNAPDLLRDLIYDADEPVTILALGPLTNIAALYENDPAVMERIGNLYIMGGAVNVPGNVYDENLGFDNKTAEWNIYADPAAAQIVFEAPVPITLIPLDATNFVPVDFELFRQFENSHEELVSRFVFNIFYINQGWIDSGFYYLWDTLAAAALTSPSVVQYETMNLSVITDAGPDYGRTFGNSEGMPVRVAVAADRLLFHSLFVRVLGD